MDFFVGFSCFSLFIVFGAIVVVVVELTLLGIVGACTVGLVVDFVVVVVGGLAVDVIWVIAAFVGGVFVVVRTVNGFAVELGIIDAVNNFDVAGAGVLVRVNIMEVIAVIVLAVDVSIFGGVCDGGLAKAGRFKTIFGAGFGILGAVADRSRRILIVVLPSSSLSSSSSPTSGLKSGKMGTKILSSVKINRL